jgi:ribosomal protein S18 acetylase RimI-like enzyme
MNLFLAQKNDAQQIAEIHKQEIDQGFLSKLGLKFLSKLYQAMISSKDSFVVVAKENNKVIGFVSGCINVKRFYKHFLKKYTLSALIILLPKLFSFDTIKKILETLKYSKKGKKDLPETELLVIAVKKEFHGQKIAVKMFDCFVVELKKRGIKTFRVVVGENLSRAIGFYEKVGFKFHSNINIHENNLSRIYIYNIK